MGEEDLRKYLRIARELVVSVRERHVSREEERQVEARTRNLGEGGVFIEMADPPPKGTIVEIEFAPPGGGEPVRTLGIVRWNTGGPPAPGMGVRFAPFDEEERRRLAALVRDIAEEEPAEED